MTLQRYLENSWIREHRTSPEEIAELLAIAERDVEQSATPGLAAEWRFAIAYNAALQLATAALAAEGYQGERENKHMRTIETLAFTAEVAPKDVDLLDRFRRKRHTSLYDRVGSISEREADEMVELAARLKSHVLAWLRTRHPELAPGSTSSTEPDS